MHNKFDKDFYVKEALKLYDRQLYADSCYFTRSGDPNKLIDRMSAYARRYPSFNSLTPQYRECVSRAFSLVKQDYRLSEKAKPLWIYEVEYDGSKSSGYPWFKKKAAVHDEMFERAREHFHFMKYMGKKAKLDPCTFSMKGKLSSQDERKTRLVWNYPAAMTICEGVYAQPLLKRFLEEKPELFLTGKYAMESHYAVLEATGQKDSWFYGWDGKQYDATLPPFLIHMGFDILRDNVDFTGYQDSEKFVQGGIGVEKRSRNAFDTIEWYFINTPYLAPDGHLYRKRGGAPSGSTFTNLLECIMTRIVIITSLLLQNKIKYLTLLKTNGDDSALVLKYSEVNVKMFCKDIKRSFGIQSSMDKIEAGSKPSDVVVSGCRWLNHRPTRPTDEWFKLALCASSWVSDPTTSYSRLFGLYITGGYNDVTFCGFFEFFQSCYPINYWKVEIDRKAQEMGLRKLNKIKSMHAVFAAYT